MRDLLAARLDFDRANAAGVARARRATPEQTLANFHAVVEQRTGPPAALATRLVEAYVHGEDIRRAVGLSGVYPVDAVAEALRYQLRTATAMGGGRERVVGLRLVADDVALAHGDGAEVRGSALSLLLAVSGRPVGEDELRGPGASALRTGDGTWSRARLWEAVHAERAALHADLQRLSPTDWSQPSLCAGWPVEQVVAHLTAAASLGRVAWLRSVLGARFDFDLHNERRLAEQRGSTPVETLDRFRAVLSSTRAASGHTAAWLGEVIVHGQDLRQPLGITTEPDPEAVTQVARFYAARDFTVPSRTLISGLRVEADDAAFAAGSPDADLVRGPVLALTMVMAGREVFLDQLTGPGLPLLRSRLAEQTQKPSR